MKVIACITGYRRRQNRRKTHLDFGDGALQTVERLSAAVPTRWRGGERLIYVREGEGPDDRDLVLFGVYQCPECKRMVAIPEYRLGMTIPYCSACQMKGKTVQYDLLRTYWDVEEYRGEDDEEWED